ncbi:MAG: DUF488 domain-containing protein [Nitrospiraceae bacterium]
MPTLWTIGHSTRSAEEFCALLKTHSIEMLVDVRRFPGSRRYPHFGSPQLVKNLHKVGIAYRHMPDLGGRRTPRLDSQNVGWRNEGFRGYADYMKTKAFRGAFDTLLTLARTARTAVMCAEAVPWRCHRTLIADAAVPQGWDVRHIVDRTTAKPHVLTPFALLDGERLTYPLTATAPSEPTLF